MIEFIYFDLGKVIYDFDHSIGCQNVADLAGVTPEQAHNVIFESGLQDRYETGLVTDEQFHREFCEQAGANILQSDLLTAISDIFTPNTRIYSLVAGLAASGFPIGILSNTCQAHWDFVKNRFAILGLFGPQITSFAAKSMKPDSRIYQAAISEAGVAADRCFFVDDRQENVAGAIAAGMDAVLFTSVEKLIGDLYARGVRVNL